MGTNSSIEDDDKLLEVLGRARAVGFLGPGPLRAQVEHASAFIEAVPQDAQRLVDLGTGGGLPALPILRARPDITALLVEAMHKRAVFLTWALSELGLADRASVRRERAETLAHDAAVRSSADVVTARSFASPGVTAECAAGFLRVGGALVVSEPPVAGHRWPADAVRALGFAPAEPMGQVVKLTLVSPVAAGWPRPTKLLSKRPLF